MLTIYAPFKNKNSKAWEVFNGVGFVDVALSVSRLDSQ